MALGVGLSQYEAKKAAEDATDYSPGIQFQTSIINTEEAKALTMINKPGQKQQKRCRCGSIKYSRVTSKDFPVGLAIKKPKKMALGMDISRS